MSRSKQLGALLSAVPPATARATTSPRPPEAPSASTGSKRQPAPVRNSREVPLQVLVPEHIRKQLGAIANDEGTSLRALILRAVRSLGIEVTDEEVKDKRGRRSA